MPLIAFFNNIGTNKHAWYLLLVMSISLQLCATYFQHVLGLNPCVMCVYERVAMCGVVCAALLGAFTHSWFITRVVSLIAWLVASIWGAQLSYTHIDYQFNPSPWNVCDIFVRFPEWAPLNKWFPAFFEASGDCAEIVWQFLGLSMPQWLMIIFSSMAVICTVVLVSTLISKVIKH